ncbi:hypothetical protein PGTUg99_024612 [Puccinia graminis f. sp. tritici]|uniref:Secreted protein n=1 Tax=Puccinia graminis f. sp. tritici TaxID=56615 RepID=A0A5B0P4E7_PUCGR|nr:hypothetical protein PGTUg99_024612 [Puccinia graminis f. sp. tritici]
MIKTCLPSLVVVLFGLLSVARAVDVTGAYSYYPVNATVLQATGCTGMSGKEQTNEICSRSFGATSAAAQSTEGQFHSLIPT